MGSTSELLTQFAHDIADAVPTVDEYAEHDRWGGGIGPFEEEKQLEMLLEGAEEQAAWRVDSEEKYPENGQRCDLVMSDGMFSIPVEAKLARFRYDNGNIDPASYARIFSPFPEKSSSSLLTDAGKLRSSDFEHSGGLLGLYYEREDEEYEAMGAEAIAEKLCIDVEFSYDFDIETEEIARFEGLRHPHHQQGAAITWEILQ